ncbi:VWA domain-containing protein, partial [Chitinispirillales bacterium ANBcel5]|uniref:vWA domain-containing protein n=1 Tax=Cellulosispirillum alkaliphilum TaxID=3039283 RepID=UPI002A5396AA|nr:VWA domain-containing protein [Chitinispirillales bacterium ANBcel5]
MGRFSEFSVLKMFFVTLFLIVVSITKANELCNITLDVCPEILDGDTLHVPSNAVALNGIINTCNQPDRWRDTIPPAIMFVIDHSWYMRHNDPGGNRFSVTKSIIDSISHVYPDARVGLVVYNQYLYLDHTNNSHLQQLDTLHDGSYLPLLTMNHEYDGNETGYDVITELLQTDTLTGNDLVYRPNWTDLSGLDFSQRNINIAFDAAKDAFSNSDTPQEKQFILFFSGGDASYPSLNRHEYANGTDNPTTFAVKLGLYLSSLNINQMIENTKVNGYSNSNSNSELWHLNTTHEVVLETMMEEAVRPSIFYTTTGANDVAINGTYSSSNSNGQFHFTSPFALEPDITTFAIDIEYELTREVSLVPYDTVVSSTIYIQRGEDSTTIPASVSLECRNKGIIRIAHDGSTIQKVTDRTDSLELIFKSGSEMPSGVSLEVSNAVGGIDLEQVSLVQKSDSIWSAVIERELSTGPASGDGKFQHRRDDSIVVVYRNPDIPLDTLRISLPVQIIYSEGSACELVLEGCPETFDGDTIAVPSSAVALSSFIRACEIPELTRVTNPPAIMFVIDQSASMGWSGRDQSASRYTVTRELIDSLYNTIPSAEIGLSIFGSQLYYDHDSSQYLHHYPVSSTDRGAYLQLMQLNEIYEGGQTGYEIIEELLQPDNPPTWRGLGYPSQAGFTGGTNINVGFDAAKEAFGNTDIPKENQFIIFLSDGDAPRSSWVYADGVPTTFTVFFTTTSNAPVLIQEMTENIRSNGYSSNNINSDLWAIQTSHEVLMNLLMEEVIYPFIYSLAGTATNLSVNDSVPQHAQDGEFLFAQRFALNDSITEFSFEIEYEVQNSSTGETYDTTTTSTFYVQREDGISAPVGFGVNCWDQAVLSIAHQGQQVSEITENMDTLELIFGPGTDTPSGDVLLEVTNVFGSKDIETVMLNENGGSWSAPMSRVLSDSANPGDGIFQHRMNDSIIVVYRNPDIPLDTVRLSVPVNLNIPTGDICELIFATCPENYDGDTITVSNSTVSLSTEIRACNITTTFDSLGELSGLPYKLEVNGVPGVNIGGGVFELPDPHPLESDLTHFLIEIGYQFKNPQTGEVVDSSTTENELYVKRIDQDGIPEGFYLHCRNTPQLSITH